MLHVFNQRIETCRSPVLIYIIAARHNHSVTSTLLPPFFKLERHAMLQGNWKVLSTDKVLTLTKIAFHKYYINIFTITTIRQFCLCCSVTSPCELAVSLEMLMYLNEQTNINLWFCPAAGCTVRAAVMNSQTLNLS